MYERTPVSYAHVMFAIILVSSSTTFIGREVVERNSPARWLYALLNMKYSFSPKYSRLCGRPEKAGVSLCW